MERSFSRWKQQSLERVDASRKGGVDRDIQQMLVLINSSQNFFTTSSCSGRIILIDAAPEGLQVQKQNCVWLFVSHQQCCVDELMSGLSRSTGDAVLKFEPLVLHVQCRRLEDAQMLAVRSTHGLEVPLSRQGKLLVERDYVHFLSQTANQKMEENLKRIQRFYQNLQSALSAERVHVPEPPTSQEPQRRRPEETSTTWPEEDRDQEETSADVYRRRRRRQTSRNHGDGSSYELDMDNCLDLLR